MSLVSNGHQTTPNFDNCVSTSVRCFNKAYTETEKTSTLIAPGFGASSAERCRGVSITRSALTTAVSCSFEVQGDKSPGARPERGRRDGDWVYW